ncbi:MAG: hypothetical protein SRB1_02698 [Desulfobacteraceae bacterium Eth-SRB1]|nr:MAG: hypothetical protein SRB1_02698 [Desulfobacteraceae bacterium Eth-SRB1]
MANSKSDKDILEAFFEELISVEKHHRSLVIIAHGYIELFLNCIIDKKCKHGKKRITKNTRDFTLSVKLTLLNELSFLDDTLFQILDKFRKIRNRAAHEASFSITTAEWQILNNGLDRFLPGESKLKPNDLAHFCKLLIGTLWNENLDLMLKIKL